MKTTRKLLAGLLALAYATIAGPLAATTLVQPAFRYEKDAGQVDMLDATNTWAHLCIVDTGTHLCNVPIGNNAISNTLLATMPTLTFKCNVTAGTAQPTDCTVPQLLAVLPDVVTDTPGADGVAGRVPKPHAGDSAAGKYLSPSGWAVPQSASVYAPVRQTVLGGPTSGGSAPTFLPATQGTLSVTTQNVGASPSNLTVTAAQGNGLNGAVNYVTSFSSNQTWAGLPASSTVYLNINAQTGSLGFLTLAPIYQFGGAISTVNGQFTFDYQAMIGYLGNGSSAIPTPLVIVGEAVTGTTSVTSTVAYAYQGFYDSGWTATLPAGATLTSKTHNLGVTPQTVRLLIEDTTTDLNYAVGDELDNSAISAQYSSSLAEPLGVGRSRTTAFFTGGTTTAYVAMNKTTGAGANLTLANWKWKLLAWRGY